MPSGGRNEGNGRKKSGGRNESGGQNESDGQKEVRPMRALREYTRMLLLSVIAAMVAIIIALLVCLPLSSCARPATPPAPAEGGLEVLFLDVGQADAALIFCDGQYLMIDGGNRTDSDLIYSVLSRRGIDYLDYLVFSHTDEDHVGGLAGALQYAKVGVCLGPSDERGTRAFQNFKSKLEAQGVGITIPPDEFEFTLGGAEVTVTHVVTSDEDPNEDELVVRIVFGDISFLFTGDIGQKTERELIERGAELESTVLKVPHHGSAGSSGYQFLREVNPRYAVISVGALNSYGHPADAALSKYRDLGCELYRTDLHGDVTMISDGIGITISTQKQTAKDVFASSNHG
jgi:competence protein ComEC